MKDLTNNARRFHQSLSDQQQATYAELANGQTPQALFITCVDARVMPQEITDTAAGDMLTLRTIGNRVPPLAEAHGNALWAAIEYGVCHLHIPQIIVCGHASCGAINALHHPPEHPQQLCEWCATAQGDLQVLPHIPDTPTLAAHDRISQQNVVLQCQRIAEHPDCARKIGEQSLTVTGWWFDIGSATVHQFDQSSQTFEPLI